MAFMLGVGARLALAGAAVIVTYEREKLYQLVPDVEMLYRWVPSNFRWRSPDPVPTTATASPVPVQTSTVTVAQNEENADAMFEEEKAPVGPQVMDVTEQAVDAQPDAASVTMANEDLPNNAAQGDLAADDADAVSVRSARDEGDIVTGDPPLDSSARANVTIQAAPDEYGVNPEAVPGTDTYAEGGRCWMGEVVRGYGRDAVNTVRSWKERWLEWGEGLKSWISNPKVWFKIRRLLVRLLWAVLDLQFQEALKRNRGWLQAYYIFRSEMMW